MHSLDKDRPRVVGFEVPPLSEQVDHGLDMPLVALLNCEPIAHWTMVFFRHVLTLTGPLGIAEVRIEHDQIRFFGSRSDARSLSDAVRALVERVSALATSERSDAPHIHREP